MLQYSTCRLHILMLTAFSNSQSVRSEHATLSSTVLPSVEGIAKAKVPVLPLGCTGKVHDKQHNKETHRYSEMGELYELY